MQISDFQFKATAVVFAVMLSLVSAAGAFILNDIRSDIAKLADLQIDVARMEAVINQQPRYGQYDANRDWDKQRIIDASQNDLLRELKESLDKVVARIERLHFDKQGDTAKRGSAG